MNTDNLTAESKKVLRWMTEFQQRADFEKLLRDFESRIAYEQYGSGGETMHRGYYCPSMIEDIVVGNAKRGRLLTHKSTRTPTSPVFGFNHQNQLILVKCEHTVEFIFHLEQSEIGITVDENSGGLSCVSECQYRDGKLFSYMFALCQSFDNKIAEISKEQYEYFPDKFCAHWSRACPLWTPWIYEHTKYIFSVDDGYLANYRLQEYDTNGKRKRSPWDDRVFEVRLKRKV